MAAPDPKDLTLFERMALIGAASHGGEPLEMIPPLSEKVATHWDRVKAALDGDDEFSRGNAQRPRRKPVALDDGDA